MSTGISRSNIALWAGAPSLSVQHFQCFLLSRWAGLLREPSEPELVRITHAAEGTVLDRVSTPHCYTLQLDLIEACNLQFMYLSMT
jgi:hypothetical protein